MTKKTGSTLATAAQLVVVGLVGPFIFAILLTLIALGIGFTPVLGIGLLILALAAPLVWAVAWAEEARVAGLYGLDLPQRSMPSSNRTDWLRLPHTILKQFYDRSNLRALLHLLVATLLGLVSLATWQFALSGLILTMSAARGGSRIYELPWFGFDLNRTGAIGVGIGIMAVGLAVVWLLTLVHRYVSEQLLAPSREAEFAAQAAESVQRRDEAMRAAEVERTRIERDLHDGVQPRLVSVGMTLGMARGKLESDPEAAAALIDEAHASTKAAITELRQLARGIHPAVLTDRGLDAALSAVAARSHIPVQLDVTLSGRCSEVAEAAMYFAVSEALTNTAKHSGATGCRVTVLQRPGGTIWARIEDDGHGGAHRVPGGGIDGVANRVAAAGGSMYVISPTGGPTTIEVSIPCAF